MIRSKALGVLVTLCMATGLLVSLAAPAHAQQTGVASFMPDAENADKDQLSDKNDGVDEQAHLTAVADEDTQSVTWFFCDDTSNVTPSDPDTFEELFQADCEEIGTDDEGVDPSDGGDPDQDNVDELAFELFTGLGGSDTEAEDEYVDVAVVACDHAGAPTDEDDVDDNCSIVVEDSVYIDDTDTDDPVTTEDLPTGEIIGVCYADKRHGQGGTDELDSNDCDSEDDYMPLIHGDVVSADGFYLLYSTSSDVTGAGSSGVGSDDAVTGACYEIDRDHDTEPGSCDTYDDEITNIAETRDYNRFIAEIPGYDLDSIVENCEDDNDDNCDTELDLGIFGEEEDDDNTECTTDWQANNGDACTFDEHYLHVATDEASQVAATLNDDNRRASGNVSDQEQKSELRDEMGTTCEDPITTATDEVGNVETVLGCLLSQFGRTATDTALTFESEGSGGFVAASCEGQSEDTDSDGDVDICSEDTTDFQDIDGGGNDFSHPGGTEPTVTGETDVTGTASVDITSDQSGTQTITVCADDEAGEGEIDDDDAGDIGGTQGCDADEPSATVTKTWGGAGAAQIDLVFQAEGGAEDCAEEREFKQNSIGDTDTLVVCTYDEFGNLTSTDNLGADLEWDVENPTVASFTDQAGNPPSETGADGTETATIRANSQGTTDITVCLQATGQADQCDSVSKTVTGEGPPPPAGRPECSDGVDNDGDGLVDSADTDCTSPNDTSENPSGAPLPLCSNNVDDDGDGRTDEQDPGCSGPNDGSESPDPQPPVRSNTNTTIRYDESAGAFKGSVGSNRKACSRFRRVILKKVKPGPNKTVGRDRSNRAGNWKVRKPRANGNFYAVATRKRFTNRFGRLIICLRDKSPTINV